ncbi:hypothetical protein ACNOYE_27940 [Nannocystaceae bacterium ST9]
MATMHTPNHVSTLLLHSMLFSVGMLGCDESPSEELGSAFDILVEPSLERRAMEVSPESFDLIQLWLDTVERGHAGSAMSLPDFVSLYDPELSDEIEQIVSPARAVGFRSGCGCQLLAKAVTTEASEDKYFYDDPKGTGHWTYQANGAAHRGRFDRYNKNHESGYTMEKPHSETTFSLRLVCMNDEGLACVGSCKAQMYVYSEYSSALDAWADVSWLWVTKGAHGSAADAVTLTYYPPFKEPLVLFEKAGSVNQYSHTLTYEEAATLQFVVGATLITAGIVAGVPPDPILLSQTATSAAVMTTASGDGGTSFQEMYVQYDPFSAGYFDIDYSSAANSVHSVALVSAGTTRNRGFGAQNIDQAGFASAYLLSVAVDHLECDVGVLGPAVGCISRYATTLNAPYSEAFLQTNNANFFGLIAAPCNDLDNDGISDQDDECPSTPEGTEVDGNGCASTGLLVCHDGTLSPSCSCEGSWVGCCSWHGGVLGCG